MSVVQTGMGQAVAMVPALAGDMGATAAAGPGALSRGSIIVLTAAAAGVALLRPLAPPSHRARLLACASAPVAAALQLVEVVGGRTWMVATVVATLAVPGVLSRRWLPGAAGLVAAVLLGIYAAATVPGPDDGRGTAPVAALAVVQVLAATVGLGAVFGLRQGAVRGTAAAAAALVVVAGTGLAVDLLTGTAAGDVEAAGIALTVVKTAVVVIGLAALAVLGHRPFPSARRWVAVAVAVLVGGGLVSFVPRPVSSPSGVPVLASVRVGERPVTVLIAPGRPGWNLVHAGGDGLSAGTVPAALRPLTARPGAANTWTEVFLPAGESTVLVSDGADTARVPVDTGDERTGPDLRGPDGPECAHIALGTALTGSPWPLTSCPSDALTASEAGALRGMIRFIAGRGVPAVSLVTDGSVRGRRAAEVVRAQAHAAGVEIAGRDGRRRPLLILSGWAAAQGVLAEVAAGRRPAEGTYLAPWLLNRPLLEQPAGQLIALCFDPGHVAALSFTATVAHRFPGEPATAAAYSGWSRDACAAGPASTRLYAATKVYLAAAMGMGDEGHAGHGAAGAGWLPEGAVTPVSGPLDVG